MHELTPGVFYDLSHVTKVSMYETMGCWLPDSLDRKAYYVVETIATYGQIFSESFEDKIKAEARLKELLQMIEEAKQ